MFMDVILHLGSIKSTNNVFTLPFHWSDVFFFSPHKTSNCLTWTLHLLSKYPQCQELLFKEVSVSVPADRAPSAEEVTQMPYLRAVVKESLRWGCREAPASKWTTVKRHTNIPAAAEKRNITVFVLFFFKYLTGCFQWFLWTEESWQTEMWWLVDIAFQRMWLFFP